MTSSTSKMDNAAPPASQDGPSNGEDFALSGFDEIENAFDRVSSVADALLDSIRDDSLRGRQRADSRRQASRQDAYKMFLNNDFYEDDDNSTVNSCDFSFRDYGNHDDDDASLGGSIDGSLVHDMKKLKSVAKAINEELQKEGEAFSANVTKTDNGKSFFEELQAKTEAEALPIQKIEVTSKEKTAINTAKKIHTPPREIYSKKNDSNILKSNNNGVQVQQPPPSKSSSSTPEVVSFFMELQTFCTDLLGKDPNKVFLVINVLVWVVFCKLVWVGKKYFMNDDGVLAPPLGSAVDPMPEVLGAETLNSLEPGIEVIEY